MLANTKRWGVTDSAVMHTMASRTGCPLDLRVGKMLLESCLLQCTSSGAALACAMPCLHLIYQLPSQLPHWCLRMAVAWALPVSGSAPWWPVSRLRQGLLWLEAFLPRVMLLTRNLSNPLIREICKSVTVPCTVSHKVLRGHA